MRAELESFPLWAKGGVVGVICMLLMFLVYQIAVERNRQFTSFEEKMDRHETNRARDSQQINAFLYAICLNTAEDDTERARCAIALDGGLEKK